MTNEKQKMKTRVGMYIGGALIILANLTYQSVNLGKTLGTLKARAKQVYFHDINNDGLEDLIITNDLGENILFLQQEEGNYKLSFYLERGEYRKSDKDSNKKYQEIESRYNSMEEKAKTYMGKQIKNLQE